MISGGDFDRRIVGDLTSRGRVDEAVAVVLYVHLLEEEAFVTRFLAVFDEHASGAIKPPHLKAGPEEAAVREDLVQTGHGMEAIERDSLGPIKTVIGAILHGAGVEQTFASDSELEPFLVDLVGSPHCDRDLVLDRKADGLLEVEIFAGR